MSENTERDGLAAVIERAYDLNEGMASFELLAHATLAAGYRKPRTITTVAELDALPVGSVVGDWIGRVYQKDAEDEAPEFPWWMTAGDQRRYHANRITLPATLLHTPEASL